MTPYGANNEGRWRICDNDGETLLDKRFESRRAALEYVHKELSGTGYSIALDEDIRFTSGDQK